MGKECQHAGARCWHASRCCFHRISTSFSWTCGHGSVRSDGADTADLEERHWHGSRLLHSAPLTICAPVMPRKADISRIRGQGHSIVLLHIGIVTALASLALRHYLQSWQ